MPPFNKINEAITKMRNAYGSSVGVTLDTSDYYWSSSEYSSYQARGVSAYGGDVSLYNKDSGRCCVRAFLKVSPLDLSGISPESAPNGVYVYANNGKLYSPDNWDTANNDLVLGVAVVTDNCKFAIDKSLPMVNNIAWSDALYNTLVDGVFTTTSSDTARTTEYSGLNNTNSIRSASPDENSSNNAAHYCYEQTLNGQNGYLPATGELGVMWENKIEIDNILTIIDSQTISSRYDEFQTQYEPLFWSSTEFSATRAWLILWERSSYIPLVYKDKDLVSSSYYTFPVFPITPTATLTLHIVNDMITFQFRKGDMVNLSYYVPGAYTTTFIGWYGSEDYSGEEITQIDAIESDMVLYAKMTNDPSSP